MPDQARAVATRFVDLTLEYRSWDKVIVLSSGEMRIILDIVSAAGFEVKEVVVRKLVGEKPYPINSLCPFKVIGGDGKDYIFATGWLDCALQCVVNGITWQNKGRDELIEAIIEEIQRSIPLKPIQITSKRDFLCENPPSTLGFGPEYFVNHTRDKDELSRSCVGSTSSASL